MSAKGAPKSGPRHPDPTRETGAVRRWSAPGSVILGGFLNGPKLPPGQFIVGLSNAHILLLPTNLWLPEAE